MNRKILLAVLDPTGKKVCDLYDSSCQFAGQATDLTVDYSDGELTELTFNLPMHIEDAEGNRIENHRWEFIKNEYKILYSDDDVEDVFNIKIPEEGSRGDIAAKGVKCLHRAEHLKRRGLTANYTSEIGNAKYHTERALENTGWTLGDIDEFYEEDVYDKHLTVSTELTDTPDDMAFGAYAEIRSASGATKWNNIAGWINAHIKVTSCGKNLCDGMFEQGGLNEVDGTPAYSESTARYRSINYLYVKPYAGKKLVLSGLNSHYAIWHLFNEAKEQIGYSFGEEYVIIPASGCSYIKYELLANEAGTANFVTPPTEIQIEVDKGDGVVPSAYEKYAAPYSIEFTLGAHDTVCRNRIERYTVYNDTAHTYSKGGLQETDELTVYSVKLYKGGHIYAEIDGAADSDIDMVYTVTDAENAEPREKYRSVDKEQGVSAYDQLKDVACIFGGKLKFDGLHKQVSLKKCIGRDTGIAFKTGYNMSGISRQRSTTEIMTRLFVINQTSQEGYIGIEDVNPLGTDFLLDFSYYRDLGLLTEEYEEAINDFAEASATAAAQQKAAYDLYTFYSNSLNKMVGRTPMGMAEVAGASGNNVTIGTSLYYDGGEEPKGGDIIYIRGADGKWNKREVSEFNYGTRSIVLTEAAGKCTTAWWMSKPAAGTVGARIITLDTKQSMLDNYDSRIAELENYIQNPNLNKEEKDAAQTEIDELTVSRDELSDEVNELNNGSATVVGLNQYFAQLVKEVGEYSDAEKLIDAIAATKKEILDKFENTMGELLHDGVYPDGDYAAGQELALYEDALEYLHDHAVPQAEYGITAVDRSGYGEEFADERLMFGDIVYIDDPVLRMNGITAEITKYTDKPMSNSSNSFTVSNFKEKPVELFEMIVKGTETITTNKKKYDAAAAIFDAQGTINAELIKSSLVKSGAGSDIDLSGNQSVVNIAVSQLTTQNINNAGINWADISRLNADVAVIVQASIKNANIDAAQIRDLTADMITAGTLDADRIAAGSITAEHISSYNITTDNAFIGAGVIGETQIADGSITEAKIVSLNADVIQSGTIATDRLLLTGEGGIVYEINASSSGLSQTELTKEKYQKHLNGSVIVAQSITAAQIAARSITGNEILAGTITAGHIDVSDLFAAQATIDALNATDISSNTYLKLAISEAVEDVESQVNDLQTQIELVPGQIKQTVASMRVGGTQLIRGSRQLSTGQTGADGWGFWNCSTYTYNGSTFPNHTRLQQSRTDSEEWQSSARTPLIRLPDDWQGKQATLSAYISATLWSQVDKGITWALCLSDGSTQRGYLQTKSVVVPGKAEFDKDIEYDTQPMAGKLIRGWTTYTLDEASFTPATDVAPTYNFADCTHMFVQFWLKQNGEVQTVAPKLEWGNKPTDWSPAPEDVDADIEGVRSELTITADGISATVEELASDVETSLSLKADQATLNTTAENLQTQIDLVPDQISLAVNQIQVGGMQLLRDTRILTPGADADYWRYTAGASNYADPSGFYRIRLTASGAGVDTWYNASSPLSRLPSGWYGRKVVLSAWVYSDDWAAIDEGITWALCLSQGGIERLNYCDKAELIKPGVVELGRDAVAGEKLINRKWIRISTTYTLDSSYFYNGTGVLADNTHIFVQFYIKRNGDYRIYGPKLEFGNQVTDWSEHPEEFRAGSSIKMTKEEVNISTEIFNVDIVDSDGETNMLSIDKNGAQMQSLVCPDVAPRYNGPSVINVNSEATSDQIAAGDYYRSIADVAVALSNKWISKDVTVKVAAGTVEYGTVTLRGIYGSGTIYIFGAEDNPAKLVGKLEIMYNGCPVFIRYLNVDSTSGGIGIDCAGASTMAIIEKCVITGKGVSVGGGRGVRVYRGAHADVHECELYDHERSLYAQQTGSIQAYKCKGNCMIAASGGTIYASGSMPSDSTDFNYGSYAGQIIMADDITVNGNAATPPAAEAIPTTVNVTANATDSWSSASSAWRQQDNIIRQGYYNGMGEWSGCFWFPTTSFSGKTIKTASLTLTRTAGSGKSSEVTLKLHGITIASATGNPTVGSTDYGVLGTIANGETKTFTLPLNAAQALANGTIKGFMLYANDGSAMSGRSYSTNYCKIGSSGDVSPKLNVTHQ